MGRWRKKTPFSDFDNLLRFSLVKCLWNSDFWGTTSSYFQLIKMRHFWWSSHTVIGWYHRDESARFATKWPESSRVSTFAILELKFMTKYHSHTVAKPNFFVFCILIKKWIFVIFAKTHKFSSKVQFFHKSLNFAQVCTTLIFFARTICFARRRAHQVANRDMRNSNRKLINVHDGLASRKFVEKFHQLL